MLRLPAAALLVAGAAAACVHAPGPWLRPDTCHDFCARSAAPHAPAPRTRNVVLVTIDGTRWQEIFGGVDAAFADAGRIARRDARALLPNIYLRLVDHGVAIGAPGRGFPMRASGPEYASLPGYQELLTGRPATHCGNNRCRAVDTPTLLDRVRDGFQLAGSDVAAIASWERMERATSTDNRSIVCSVGRSHGPTREALRVSECAGTVLDQAAGAGPAPGHVDYRADRYTMTLALEYLSTKRPRALFVGLGDTDEYGHAGDYAAYLGALAELDRFIGDLFGLLEKLDVYGRETTVVLTTDHGWAEDFSSHGGSDPESGQVFLLAAGGAVPIRGIVSPTRAYHLADVTPTLLALLGLPPVTELDAGHPMPELLPEGEGR